MKKQKVVEGQAMELREKSKQLEELNNNLENRIKEEIEKRREQEQLLIQQSKLAAMGEMMGAIAHQWQQPLNSLEVILQDMGDAYNYGELDKKYIVKSISNGMMQIQFMSKTIDDFRGFFSPSKKKKPFDLKMAIRDVLYMTSAQLKNSMISFIHECICKKTKERTQDTLDIGTCNEEYLTITGYPNEFKHVVLNILSNARDAILEKRKKGLLKDNEKGVIDLNIMREEEVIVMKIMDNGGGIPDVIKDKIFEPYFTTKEKSGTGIGLYMSKVIIENHMGGKLFAENTDKGAMFTIEFQVAS